MISTANEYALLTFLVLVTYLFHHYWRRFSKRESSGTSYEDDVERILHGEEFKVKGRFEQ